MATKALSRFQAAFGKKAEAADDEKTSPGSEKIQDEEKKSTVDGVAAVNGDGSESEVEHVSGNAQDGVKAVEATALAWSRTTLILVFLK
jgi:hypothetical protein